MLTIFTNPDTTKYPSQFQAIKSPGLEEKTGADMVISFLTPNPLTGQILSPVDHTKSHIIGRSLFVQIKIGYDIVPTDDRLKSSIARMMKCHIPKGQAVLLPISDFWEKDGLLRVRGKKEFGNRPFSTLETIYDDWDARGGIVEPSPPHHIDNLQSWIDRKQKRMEKIRKQGAREIYPPSPEYKPDDIWQAIEEIDSGWPRLLVSGLKDCGSATVNGIFKYASAYYPENPLSAFHIFTLMSDEDNKGRAVHKIPQWGDVSRKKFRKILGLVDGWNLSELAYRLAFYQGWKSFGREFKRLVEKDKSVKEVHKKLMDKNPMADLENEIPF